MSTFHRLIAILVVWVVFAWSSFFMFGLSITLFMPPLVVVIMTIVFVLAALFATFVIMQSSEHSS